MSGKAGVKRAPDYSDGEIAVLVARWKAGESAADIGAVLGRSSHSVCTKAHKLGLERRYRGWRKGGHGAKGRFGDAIAGSAHGMKPENTDQAAAWAGIRFDDSRNARRREPRLRGQPEPAMTLTGCAAAMTANL